MKKSDDKPYRSKPNMNLQHKIGYFNIYLETVYKRHEDANYTRYKKNQ